MKKSKKLTEKQVQITHVIFIIAVLLFMAALIGDMRTEGSELWGVEFKSIGSKAGGLAVGVAVFAMLSGGGLKSFIYNISFFIILFFVGMISLVIFEQWQEEDFTFGLAMASFVLITGVIIFSSLVWWFARLILRKFS